MKLTIARVVEDLKKSYPTIVESLSFKYLEVMAGTRAIGTQGIDIVETEEQYAGALQQPAIPIKVITVADLGAGADKQAQPQAKPSAADLAKQLKEKLGAKK